MIRIQYSAPGKVILSGEHAVVYGKPALVCAIDKRLSITFKITTGPTHYLDDIFPILEQSVISYIASKKEKVNKVAYSYTIDSSIPIGRGLGSSAAYCACISAGLLELFTGREWSKEEVNICAYQMEKYFHKNSSGVDTTTSVMGGLIYYRKEFEFLKTISSLSIKIPKNILDSLILIDTGKPDESSGVMIQAVGSLYNKKSTKTEIIFNEIEKTTKRIIVSLMKEDLSFFSENIKQNEALLEKIGVVSSKSVTMLESLSPYGVGKITGAGGKKNASGYLLFVSNDISHTVIEVEKLKLEYMALVPSYTGLTKEE